MIAFITIKSSLVPLIEGLCAQSNLTEKQSHGNPISRKTKTEFRRHHRTDQPCNVTANSGCENSEGPEGLQVGALGILPARYYKYTYIYMYIHVCM